MMELPMALFSRPSVDARWDDPTLGLTERDFQRWPGKYKPKREKVIPKVEDAHAAGTLKLPVTLVGQCTTYDSLSGHNSFGAATHERVDFVVSSGSSGPTITAFHKRGVTINDFDPDETLIETIPTHHGGYIDLQFLGKDGTPRGRIGFIFSHGGEEVARSCAHLVGAAIKAASAK
jgi:hypothetical protein